MACDWKRLDSGFPPPFRPTACGDSVKEHRTRAARFSDDLNRFGVDRVRRAVLAGLGAWAFARAGHAGGLPVVRVAALQIGTVNWELETIVANGFDRAHGFELRVQSYADNAATRVALEGGEADVMVADWIWAARQRAAGRDYVFVPYSRAVGGLMVPADSPAQTLADLAGKKIGIAGGPLDKSWLVLRAHARNAYGMDLEAETEQVYGAPPLIYRTALSGATDASLNFWHFLARMRAQGMREMVSVAEATRALGLNPDTPLLGYILREALIAEHPGIARALHAASRDAKTLLARDDAAWEAIRGQMHAETDAEYQALREDFLAGTPVDAPVDTADADAFLRLMAELGGAELVGGVTSLPAGLFAALE